FATSSENELPTIYSNRGDTADVHDIAVDYCGPFAGFTSKTGWDFCTGVGSVHGNAAGSKRARFSGTRMSTTTIQILTTPAHLHHACAGGAPLLTYGWLRRRSLLAPSDTRIDQAEDGDPQQYEEKSGRGSLSIARATAM